MLQILIQNVLRQLREHQDGLLWFDQCLRDKLSGLTDEEAFIRPIPEVRSIAEHVSHILKWRKEALRRFNMERTVLMKSPDDWKDNTTLREVGWYRLRELLYERTALLIQALEGKGMLI